MKNQKYKKNEKPLFVRLIIKLQSISPVQFYSIYLCFILNGLTFGVMIKIKQLVFDHAASYVNGDTSTFTMVSLIVGLLLVEVLSIWLSFGGSFIAENFDIKATGILKQELFYTIDRMNAIDFEDPTILDDIDKSNEGIVSGISFINGLLDLFFMYFPTILIFTIYLYSVKPILVVVLLCIFVPVIYAQFIKSRIHSRLEDTLAPLKRQHRYFVDAAVGKESFKETRLLGSFNYFKKQSIAVLDIIQKKRLSAVLKNNAYELTSRLLALLGYIGVLWLLFVLLLQKEISIGAFVAIFTSLGEIYELVEDAIVRRIGTYAMNYGKVKNYFNLLDREEIPCPSNPSYTGKIQLSKLYFQYPQSAQSALSDINLEINTGEVIAIVGENGSGKTTLAKILGGLYHPTRGAINHGIFKSHHDKQLLTSQVFQNFVKYKLSLSDNIWISQTSKKINDDSISAVFNKVHLTLDEETYPNGYDTILSSEFGGVDLSGGQWQRIASARAFYRDSQLMILDEPTSAIDPIEEEATYQRFYQLLSGKTGIIITHRLGAVRYADRVVVMNNGHIVAQGPHDVLINSCETYSNMWYSQKSHYS